MNIFVRKFNVETRGSQIKVTRFNIALRAAGPSSEYVTRLGTPDFENSEELCGILAPAIVFL